MGRLLIARAAAARLLPRQLYTSYELLQRASAAAVRGASAAIFLVYRTLADGIRLHAAALVLAVASGRARAGSGRSSWRWAGR